MGLRKGEGCGVRLVRECWWVLEWHWLWADVQVEGGVEQVTGSGKRNGVLDGSGIAAREREHLTERKENT
jgi:hypothetical protein